MACMTLGTARGVRAPKALTCLSGSHIKALRRNLLPFVPFLLRARPDRVTH